MREHHRPTRPYTNLCLRWSSLMWYLAACQTWHKLMVRGSKFGRHTKQAVALDQDEVQEVSEHPDNTPRTPHLFEFCGLGMNFEHADARTEEPPWCGDAEQVADRPLDPRTAQHVWVSQHAPMMISSEQELSETCSPHSQCKVCVQVHQSNVAQRTMLPQLTAHPASYVAVVDPASAFSRSPLPEQDLVVVRRGQKNVSSLYHLEKSPCASRLERVKSKTGSTTRTVPLNIMVTIRCATIGALESHGVTSIGLAEGGGSWRNQAKQIKFIP